ncbi:unnamed protein product [Discula destructiva]
MAGVIRLGRGGAGNFVQQKDIEEAAREQQAKDLEAQKPSTPPPAPAPAPQVPQYIRSGRGGAGNFAEPPTLAEMQAREDVVDRTDAAVSASQAGKPRTGLSGRGGAGNWTDNSGTAQDDETNGVHAMQSQIENKVVHDIDESLPPPPRTYHQHGRETTK